MTCTPVRTIAALLADRKAATAVEYAVIMALVTIALAVGVVALGGANKSLWTDIHDKVSAARS